MKRLLVPLIFTTMCVGFAQAEPFSIPNVGVTFEGPPGFTALSKEEIAVKYSQGGRPPEFAIGNARRTTSIAFGAKPQPITEKELPLAKQAFERTFERVVPGIDWKDRKLIELQGQQWIYLEMTSRAIDTDIHNIMLVTPRQGNALIFNFNSTRSEFPTVESELRKSIASIRFEGKSPAVNRTARTVGWVLAALVAVAVLLILIVRLNRRSR